MAGDGVRVVDIGITCLHPGGSNPRADVVFVHGLGGHPQSTWSTEPYEPEASAQQDILIRKRKLSTLLPTFLRLNVGSKSLSRGEKTVDGSSEAEEQPQANQGPAGDGKSKTSASESSFAKEVFWPRDLLPKDVEDVRVMTFGYYSNPGGSSQDNLYTLSKNLLGKLANERTSAPNRPIIFVVHSLGGILTKFALKISQDSTGADARLKTIRDSTRGVIFFGTPHSGSNMASWGELLRRIAGIFAVTNSTLLAALDAKNDNGQLEELRRSFVRMLGPRNEGKFQVFSFRETKPLVSGPLGPVANLVVPLESSDIVSEWASDLTVAENHHNICKFGGFGDPGYKDLVHVLQGFLNEINAEDQFTEFNSKRMELLQTLFACLYKDRKDRNPPRVTGTCEWFTNHQLFQQWRQTNTASMLWVSADPGCGKSVLAKFLVDEVLPSTTARTTCYFFFKDDFEDQRLSTTALCCILHQIFIQHPASFSNQILKQFEEGGEKLLTSFRELWDILISIAISHKGGEIVCIFDALDECEVSGRHQLIKAVSQFYSGTTKTRPTLKFLLTSRPYSDIKREFYDLERELPTIHLSGENEEVVDKISREIDLVVGSKVAEVGRRLNLLQEEQYVLQEELMRAPNRTYLWVHLIFDIITNSIIDRLGDIPSIVKKIPKTVEAAYDRILSKSPDVGHARKLLHIVVAAARPLTLQEMALALAIKPHHRSFDDLKLGPEDRIRHNIRQHCGLFVVVIDSKIYLLHQTAREFLVPPPSIGPSLNPSSTTLQWKFSLHPRDSNRILAEICIWRLSLSDLNPRNLRASPERKQYIGARTLLGYAAQFWADHFRNSDWDSADMAAKKALSFFTSQLPASLAWFEIYQTLATKDVPENFTPLVVASYFGLIVVVQQLLEAGADANAKDNGGRTPLRWASAHGHDTVVQQLLEAGADVNAKGKDGRTPLHGASAHGHSVVVQQLLEAGADTNAKDDEGRTPLRWASMYGHDMVVQRLLEAGIDINAKDKDGRTPLHGACAHGHDMVVQQLLEAGADTNAKDNGGRTPLRWASAHGHDMVVQQLLEAGADTNAKDNGDRTPLRWASAHGHDIVVQRLLEAGADANAKDKDSRTLLHGASAHGHNMVVQQLLEAGADTNAKDNGGRTPLRWASAHGHDMVVQQLLEAGADANAKDNEGRTPLRWASMYGHDTVVQRLLEAGADVNAKDKDGRTPLHGACAHGHDMVVQQLLEAGSDTNAKDDEGRTPLRWASMRGHDMVQQRLLETSVNL